jgi:hypothetical protein
MFAPFFFSVSFISLERKTTHLHFPTCIPFHLVVFYLFQSLFKHDTAKRSSNTQSKPNPKPSFDSRFDRNGSKTTKSISRHREKANFISVESDCARCSTEQSPKLDPRCKRPSKVTRFTKHTCTNQQSNQHSRIQ